jgi:hypothetical protein
MCELLEQAHAAVDGGDGVVPLPMPVAVTLEAAVCAAARTRRPAFVQVDELPVTVFPAGSKPACQPLVSNVQPDRGS